MEKLFDISEVNSKPGEISSPGSESALQSLFQPGDPSAYYQLGSKAKDLLNQVSECLKTETHIDFVSAGELSLHHMILHFMKLHGPGDLYISSWAIKEDPARALLSLKEQGMIKELYGVFDYRIRTLDAKHFHLIENAFTSYALTKNHSKVVVIDTPGLKLAIISSANLSNNPRIETGIISTVTSTVEFHKQWMRWVLQGKKVY